MTLRTAGKTKAFTLIEVLVATAIAGMMLVVVMGLVGNLRQQITENKVKYYQPPWLGVLKKQLEFDFANCRSIIVKDGQIILDGYSQFDDISGATTRLPTLVTYRLTGPAGRASWLVRDEQRLTGDVNSSSKTSVVCFGITQLIDHSGLNVDFPPSQWRVRFEFLDDEKRLQKVSWVLFRHGGIEQ